MMVEQKNILFITSSEHGQANIALAVVSELLRHGKFEIHVASYAALQPRIVFIRQSFAPGQDVTFHVLPGISMLDTFKQEDSMHNLLHPPGIKGALASYELVPRLMAHWTNGRYMQLYQRCKELIQSIQPLVVVTEPVSAPAVDACNMLGQKLVFLTPMGLKELLASVQPRLAVLWKFPAMASGYDFPLPWLLIPANIYIIGRLIILVLFSARFREIAAVRKQAGIRGPIPSLEPYTKHAHYLCPAICEIDYPLATIPDNVTSCGPILFASQPLSTADSSLAAWLQRGPIVLVNLGSHVVSHATDALHLAQALRLVCERYRDVQILWKLTWEGDVLDDAIAEMLGDDLVRGRIRVVRWLKADPAAILESGHVVCSVHHGGANSYFEATRSGVPQVILPVWFDTYSTAVCAEYRGIGIYGNRGVAPHIDATEVGLALCMVLDKESVRGGRIRQRAEALGELCRRTDGKVVAAGEIARLARGAVGG